MKRCWNKKSNCWRAQFFIDSRWIVVCVRARAHTLSDLASHANTNIIMANTSLLMSSSFCNLFRCIGTTNLTLNRPRKFVFLFFVQILYFFRELEVKIEFNWKKWGKNSLAFWMMSNTANSVFEWCVERSKYAIQ